MKIICIGRNYRDHAREMQAPDPTEPVIFLKPETALIRPEQDFWYPLFSQDIHFECELYFRIGRPGKYINRKFAWKHIDGYGLGIDFTARDLQSKLKKEGLPWEISKAFNGSAAASQTIEQAENQSLDVSSLHYEFFVNGVSRQKGKPEDMIFGIEELVEYASQFFTLQKGDLIFTGTPAGVGPVKIGDRLEAQLQGKTILSLEVH